MEKFITEDVGLEIKKRLQEMQRDVELILFTRKIDCDSCTMIEGLLTELVSFSDKLRLTISNAVNDEDLMKQYGVELIPALLFKVDDQIQRIHFYGVPAGYEFATILEDIILLSNGMPDQVGEDILNKFKSVDKPKEIGVYVTPTCPYCQGSVIQSHIAAILNPNITAKTYEISSFPKVAQLKGISGVPVTIIDKDKQYTGLQPMDIFANLLIEK